MAVWRPGDVIDFSKGVGKVLGIIKSAVSEGWSRNATQKYLSAQGMGVRRVDILSAYNAIEYSMKNPENYLPIDQRLEPIAEAVPLAVTRQKRTWAVDVYTKFYNRDLGYIETRTVTLSEDTLMSQEDLITLGTEVAMTYGFDIEDIIDSGISEIRYSLNPIL